MEEKIWKKERKKEKREIYSWLSRCITARGFLSGLSLWVPTKFKARKSSYHIICSLRICLLSVVWELVKFVGFSKGCDQNGDRVSKNNESCNICIRWLKSCFCELWKIWDSVYMYSCAVKLQSGCRATKQ